MKNAIKYIVAFFGLICILIFCVGATAAFSGPQTTIRSFFPEPINMLLLGIGLIGFGSFIKKRLYR